MESLEKMEHNENHEDHLVLRFSHNVIEHLGLKLYQNKLTNVLAELVSNSWDAEATRVWIHLSTNDQGEPSSVIVADDGVGMDDSVLKNSYLLVGKKKRSSKAPAEKSVSGTRDLMGRKGIGKLAPFGVAKQVDLLTVVNKTATWLRFNYDDMLRSEEGPTAFSEYEPKVVVRNAPLTELPLSEAGDDSNHLKQFVSDIEQSGSGTFVRASQLTIRKNVTPETLMKSLGRRFTVTLARPDFEVFVNGKKLEEKHAFPKWEVRYPDVGKEAVTFETAKGTRTVTCWAGFVDEAAWSQEQAGVGVYAHGKIAQDRPFFFGNRGNEIHLRYMYAVVEADWVDELERDTISTDRTSIDWEDPDCVEFYQWGERRVKDWINLYEAHRRKKAKEENEIIVYDVLKKNESLHLRDSERTHLVDLLSEVTPRLGKEAENRARLVEATAKAWTHEPARRLIKKLWDEATMFDADRFSLILSQLSDQLVPESLSLAVVFSQRVYALSQLERHITLGKETQLQMLIEQFPWILDSDYERFVPRKSLKKTCEEAEQAGLSVVRPVHLPTQSEYTKPDFVFLGATVTGGADHIVVVELKGPDDTAGWPEYEQLNSYVSYLKSRFGDSRVEGVLVARSHDEGVKEIAGKTIAFKEWKDLLLRSRKENMELIAALLAGNEADAQDSRVQQICELGGEAVTSFLAQMSARDPALRELVEKLSVKKPMTSTVLPVESSAYEEVEHESVIHFEGN
ncbi:ATP-binding protein [Marilutibacter chinensis]|uniref:ATP-binding protein n=1 Tax=Marilutibacter chinensis TaxID=2912247 RepID=A0ABS9HRP6_9GAMM|nr:ATP-binding protein [Lysobacter chinensis]MCF7221605.1 ATP-binding protein [Lysobacter chinensis]